TVLARIDEDELTDLMRGYGHRPYVFTAGFDDEDAASIHGRFAALLDDVLDEIADIKERAAGTDPEEVERPRWPMVVLRTPRGWTCPEEIDGQRVEGSWRSHQVPLSSARDTPEHLRTLEEWMRSYRPEELFDDDGRLVDDVAALA